VGLTCICAVQDKSRPPRDCAMMRRIPKAYSHYEGRGSICEMSLWFGSVVVIDEPRARAPPSGPGKLYRRACSDKLVWLASRPNMALILAPFPQTMGEWSSIRNFFPYSPPFSSSFCLNYPKLPSSSSNPSSHRATRPPGKLSGRARACLSSEDH
jgi:hypothetical protein